MAKVIDLETERRDRRLVELIVERFAPTFEERLITLAGRPDDEQVVLDLLETLAVALTEFERLDEPDPAKRLSLDAARDLCRGPVLEAARAVGVTIRPRLA